ncbi:leucine-rich repeat protein, partial [Listeria rocourtiae]|uniref:leucine-rich repeat protein n=1 Tax=Listeria rocourtiae TaxID=647910 RepID=UPI00162AB195
YTRGIRIQNLTGIEHLPALETLYLEGDQTGKISSLQGIETLKQLRVLSLKNESITSIDLLRQLPQLEEVNLVGNEIEDVAPLANLKSLTILNISGNRVTDLRTLRELAVVKTRDFQVTGVGGALGTSSLILVARNKHTNPVYQYAVTQQPLTPSYRLTVSPYPLDSQDIVGL